MSTINETRETTIRGEASPALEAAVQRALAKADGYEVVVTVVATREVEK